MMQGSEVERQIEEIFVLEEQVCLAVEEAKTFQVECRAVGKQAKQLSQMLNNLLCFIESAEVPLYMRPIDFIVSAVNDNFNLALAIVSKCKRQSLIGRLFSGRNASQFHELCNLLDASLSDMEWLVTVYDPRNGVIGPLTIKKSAKFLVWSCIATAQNGCNLEERLQAAKSLSLIAQENEEYKKIIFEEGGVPPLQELLKANSSLDAQITVANALCLLANEEKRKDVIMKEMIATFINQLSRKSPMRDQIQAAYLVASIAEHHVGLKEYDLITKNVIWRLVTLLSPEQSTGDPRANLQKLELKISCSKALLMLARGSVSNCTTLTETKGMLCLAEMVETEKGELRNNCLMILKEITTLAESNKDFRHSAFKSTSGAAKAVVKQLLRVIKEFDDAELRIPAIKSIGSLARSFSAKHSEVISPLVSQLGNSIREVALEAAISLRKFVCPKNVLSLEHSKSIVEFNGIPLLMNLLEGDKGSQLHGLALICYLAKHDENSEALIKAGALTALETTGGKVAAEHSDLKELVPAAIKLLQSNHTDDRLEESGSSKEGGIKQFIIGKSKSAFDSLKCGSSVLFEGLTGITQKPVNLLVKLSSTKMRSNKKRSSSAEDRRILPCPKVKRVDLATGYVIGRLIGRFALQVAQMLWLMKNFTQSTKKVSRRKFGYIVHKLCKKLCKFWKFMQ